jgi:hypothetical protein
MAGVFLDLGLDDFMKFRKLNRQNDRSILEYEHPTNANFEVGNIIHILQDNHGTTTGPHASCLNGRLMLVIRDKRPIGGAPRALTCVPLYRRSPSDGTGKKKRHWNVEQVLKTGTEEWHNEKGGSKPLFVKTRRDAFTLKGGITVNLDEIWHVECEGIKIRKLGRVENMSPVIDKIVKFFRKSVR